MFLLKMIRKFFKGLSGAESPTQIALGFGLGLVWGMVPAGSGLGITLLALLLLFKVSFPFAVVAGTLAKLVRLSAFGDATAGLVGFTLLEQLPLQAFWTWLLTLPVLGFLGLERWHVMGGAAVGAAAGAASFFPVRFLWASTAKSSSRACRVRSSSRRAPTRGSCG